MDKVQKPSTSEITSSSSGIQYRYKSSPLLHFHSATLRHKDGYGCIIIVLLVLPSIILTGTERNCNVQQCDFS
jgi:hypothetical protein